jgi:hypothetical protein
MKEVQKYILTAMLLVSFIGVQAQRGPAGPGGPPPDPRYATQEEAAALCSHARVSASGAGGLRSNDPVTRSGDTSGQSRYVSIVYHY